MAVCCVAFLMLPTWVPVLSKVSVSARVGSLKAAIQNLCDYSWQ